MKLRFLEYFIIQIIKKLKKAAPRFEAGAKFEKCCYNWLILWGLPDSPTTHLPLTYQEKTKFILYKKIFDLIGRWENIKWSILFNFNVINKIFICFFSFFYLILTGNSPTINEKYPDNYFKLIEIIFDIHKVDIKNVGLYEGYTMSFKDKCNAKVQLKTYSSWVKVFQVNICKNQSTLSKINQRND